MILTLGGQHTRSHAFSTEENSFIVTVFSVSSWKKIIFTDKQKHGCSVYKACDFNKD